MTHASNSKMGMCKGFAAALACWLALTNVYLFSENMISMLSSSTTKLRKKNLMFRAKPDLVQELYIPESVQGLSSDSSSSSSTRGHDSIKKKKPKSSSKPTIDGAEKSASPVKPGSTTVIVTTNYMPSIPSTKVIDSVIQSLSYLQGLDLEETPLIITVDGAYKDGGSPGRSKNVLVSQYVDALKTKYNDTKTTILHASKNILLVGNIKRALKRVNTEFVYILQHDLPFINEVNHTGLIETFNTHPDEVRIVRFSSFRILTRKRDTGVCDDINFKANGIELTKTHTWSDQNHLTRKSYYDEMFALPGWKGYRFMEKKMADYGQQNCSYWGTYLYGPRKGNPSIFHLDGRLDGQHETKTVRVFGNLSGLPSTEQVDQEVSED